MRSPSQPSPDQRSPPTTSLHLSPIKERAVHKISLPLQAVEAEMVPHLRSSPEILGVEAQVRRAHAGWWEACALKRGTYTLFFSFFVVIIHQARQLFWSGNTGRARHRNHSECAPMMYLRFALMMFFQARDLLSIYSKLVQVLYPRRKGSGREVLRYCLGPHMVISSVTKLFHPSCRDWDLWGPLVLCLLLGVMLSVNVC
jgi:hypothetical protein